MNKVLFAAFLLAAASASAELQRDIEYGTSDGVSLKMDAMIPDVAGPFPTVVLVHGGGWSGDDKQKSFQPIFEPLGKGGFAWFTVDYRLAPAYHYPAAVDDVVEAIRYIEAHARKYNVDLKRLAISGESAGGHIVAMIGARYGRELHLAAMIPFYPPTDMEALVVGRDRNPNAQRAVKNFLGVTEVDDAATHLLREASPVTYVQKGMPPYLFVHGTGDTTVNFHQTEEMCERMKQAGISCEIYAVEGALHWVGNWEKNPAFLGYKQKVVEWLRQTMR